MITSQPKWKPKLTRPRPSKNHCWCGCGSRKNTKRRYASGHSAFKCYRPESKSYSRRITFSDLDSFSRDSRRTVVSTNLFTVSLARPSDAPTFFSYQVTQGIQHSWHSKNPTPPLVGVP